MVTREMAEKLAELESKKNKLESKLKKLITPKEVSIETTNLIIQQKKEKLNERIANQKSKLLRDYEFRLKKLDDDLKNGIDILDFSINQKKQLKLVTNSEKINKLTEEFKIAEKEYLDYAVHLENMDRSGPDL